MPAPRRSDTGTSAVTQEPQAGPASPAAPRGTEYEALVNLSIPQPSSPDSRDLPRASVVEAGETVHLTDDQAHGFLTRHGVPVIRRRQRGGGQDQPRVRPRDLFGAKSAPPVGVRRDPPGATQVIEYADDGTAVFHKDPEAAGPGPDLSADPDAARDH